MTTTYQQVYRQVSPWSQSVAVHLWPEQLKKTCFISFVISGIFLFAAEKIFLIELQSR